MKNEIDLNKINVEYILDVNNIKTLESLTKSQLVQLLMSEAVCHQRYRDLYETLKDEERKPQPKKRKESTGRNPTYYGSLGQILRMRDDGKSIREIAEVVKLSPATVCRVLKKYTRDDLFQN